MSGSFEVVYADLAATATAFDHESGRFADVSASLAAPTADTGDAALTALVGRVLDSGRFLAADMHDVTVGHAGRLLACCRTYQASDRNSSALLQALVSP